MICMKCPQFTRRAQWKISSSCTSRDFSSLGGGELRLPFSFIFKIFSAMYLGYVSEDKQVEMTLWFLLSKTNSAQLAGQTTIHKNIIEQFSSSISPPDWLDLQLGATVEYAKVEIAACVVDRTVEVVGVEDAVDHQIHERKKQGRNASRVWVELLASKEGIEDKSRIREGRTRHEVCGGYGAGVRWPCFAECGGEVIIVWSVSSAISIFHRSMCRGVF